MSQELSELCRAVQPADQAGYSRTVDPQTISNVLSQLDAANRALDFHTERDTELKSTLSHLTYRIDNFAYEELSALIDDEPLDQWGERYISRRAAAEAEAEKLTAELEALKSDKSRNET